MVSQLSKILPCSKRVKAELLCYPYLFQRENSEECQAAFCNNFTKTLAKSVSQLGHFVPKSFAHVYIAPSLSEQFGKETPRGSHFIFERVDREQF